MTIRHLKIFIEVADSGKMSIAASKFYISQPTVSQIIRELEEHYHVRLFERISQKLYITPNGQQLLNTARKIVADFDAMEQSMANLNQKEIFRIGVTPSLDADTLSEVVDSLIFRCPENDYSIFYTNDSNIEERLLAYEIDVGIMAGPSRSNDLINIPLINDYLAILCPCTHELFDRESLCSDDLKNQNFAISEKGSFAHQVLDNLIHSNHLTIHPFWETSDINAIKKAVCKHNCIALAPIRPFDLEISREYVHVFMSMDNTWNMPINLVYPKKRAISQPLKVLQYIFMHLQISEISHNDYFRTFNI